MQGEGVSGVERGRAPPRFFFFFTAAFTFAEGVFHQEVYTKNTSVLNFYTAGIKKKSFIFQKIDIDSFKTATRFRYNFILAFFQCLPSRMRNTLNVF